MLRSVCLLLTALATVGGGIGVIARGLAFMNQSSVEMRGADAAAWVAVAIVFGAGLISLAIYVSRKE